MNEVFIVSAKRTPIGGFLGKLSHLSATELGAIAVRHSYESIGIEPARIDSVYLGNVLSANIGQSPARQASKFGGIPDTIDSTTINKVCAAGMKATIIGAQQIQLGLEDLVVAGGMESMSNTPHYSLLRKGVKLGNEILIDGLLKDGLTDAFHNKHMGSIVETTVKNFHITREQQDQFALESYDKATMATKKGKFKNEIIPVKIATKDGDYVLQDDEDIYKVIREKVAKLKPFFEVGGTITAANASNINDGAAALLLASKKSVEKYNLKPLAKIIAYADAAQEPAAYATAPSIAITKVLKRANLQLKNIDYLEINEAYAAVVIANQQLLGFDMNKVNSYGGAIAMGHPLGASGARIICALLSTLRQEGGKYGLAAICNGGGGASSIILENMDN
jgi:acetyl-CoA C-acetyltransferase